MAHIDDLIEPPLEQIVLSAVPTLLWPHPRISLPRLDGRKSRHAAPINLQENRSHTLKAGKIKQAQSTVTDSAVMAFGILHGQLIRRSPHPQRNTSFSPLIGETQRNSWHATLLHCIDCNNSWNAVTTASNSAF